MHCGGDGDRDSLLKEIRKEIDGDHDLLLKEIDGETSGALYTLLMAFLHSDEWVLAQALYDTTLGGWTGLGTEERGLTSVTGS